MTGVTDSAPAPQLSLILVSPYGFTVLHQLLRYLRAQTIRQHLEIILVGTTSEEFQVDDALLEGFHSSQTLLVGPIRSLNIPRAAGIRRAHAPIVALSEDHCFPAPNWAEALVKAHEGPWAAVGPCVSLANPRTYISWANHLIQYLAWTPPTPSSVQKDVPGHNSSYKRRLLLDFERDLEALLVAEARMHADLRKAGHQLYMCAEALTYHVYITTPSAYCRENYYIGRQYAANRSRHWSRSRRWVYAIGSPIVPVLRTARICRRIFEIGWLFDLVPGMLPALWLGLSMSALGEMMGYLFGMGAAAGKTLDLDFRRDRFVPAAERASIWCGHNIDFQPIPQRPSILRRLRGARP